MNSLLLTIIIGISLSMDAFSLALIYGTYGFNKRNEISLAVIVGIFHFFMPLIGVSIGNIVINYLIFRVNYIVSIIFVIIGIEMIISSYKDNNIKIHSSIWGWLLFGLSVSIDSFTTGIGIDVINSNYLEVSSIFMICSFLFTYTGLKLGNILNSKFGNIATRIGGFILIILSLYYLR